MYNENVHTVYCTRYMHTRIYTCMYTVLYLYSMLHVHVHTVHVHCTSSFVSIILLVGGSEGAECMGGAKRGLDGLRGERIVLLSQESLLSH